MTTFPCFASSFGFLNNPSVADVADIITDFRTMALAQTPAWTEPVAGTFQSPVDGVGRFYTLTLVATTSTRLQWLVQDQNGVTICDREIDCSGSGTAVNYFVGQFHAFVEILEATPEVGQSGILDETPLDEDEILNYTFGNAYRNSGGSVDGQGGSAAVLFMLDNGTPGAVNRFRAWAQTTGAIIGLKDTAGNLQFFPADVKAVTSAVEAWIGRIYQTYVCDASLAFSDQKDVKIGTAGEEGTFQVIGLTTAAGMRQMLRVA
jgi:hypothetical protein